MNFLIVRRQNIRQPVNRVDWPPPIAPPRCAAGKNKRPVGAIMEVLALPGRSGRAGTDASGCDAAVIGGVAGRSPSVLHHADVRGVPRSGRRNTEPSRPTPWCVGCSSACVDGQERDCHESGRRLGASFLRSYPAGIMRRSIFRPSA